MCRSFLILLLALGVSCYANHVAHAQAYPPSYGAQPPPASSYSSPPAQGGSGRSASTAENCGTPDDPKPCPPLPRHPLPYYPANRQ